MNALSAVVILLSMVGCASATPQTNAIFSRGFTIPSYHVIEDVPFIRQTAGHCGPATLAMVLKWSGHDVGVDSLSTQVFTPDVNGSFQADMISASRRSGMVAIPIEGLTALLEEVKSGHPVIVFENLSVSWLPQWHYAVVFGYDLFNHRIIMHSGAEAFKYWDLGTFERSWKLGNYWGLVVLPPDQLSATASEFAHVTAASVLEQLGKTESAEKAYHQILQRWPKSLIARIGLGNIAYSKKEYSKAVDLLRQAVVDHPDSAIVWHNLVFAEAAIGNAKEARRSAFEALRWVDDEARSFYTESLSEWATPR